MSKNDFNNREEHRQPHITHPSPHYEAHDEPRQSSHKNAHPAPHRNAPVNNAPSHNNTPVHPVSEDYFICMNEPAVFRRNLLEASKVSLVVIKGLYLIREIKARKQEKLSQLQKEIREIRLLMQKAEEFMPKHSRQEAARIFPHAAEKKQAAVTPKQEPAQTPSIKVVPAMTEMDRLSHSIKDIESKLNTLPGKKEAPVQAPVKEAAKPNPSNDLTAELGKTLEGIQKRLKQM